MTAKWQYKQAYESAVEETQRLRAENERLRSERDHWYVEQVHAYGNWEDAHKYAVSLKAENERLRKENTSLRKTREHEFEASCEAATNHMLEVGKLRDENAELRELCGDLFGRLMGKDERCGECRSQCEHDAWNFGDPKCVYAIRMRELGLEANG